MTSFPQKVLDEITWYRCTDCGEINPETATSDSGKPICPDCASPSLAEQVAPDLDSLVVDGVSFRPALDYWAVELHDWTQSEWAETRDVAQATVSKNVSQAEEIVSDDSELEPWHDGRCSECKSPMLDTTDGDRCLTCRSVAENVRRAMAMTPTGMSRREREVQNAIEAQVAERGFAEIKLGDSDDTTDE